jgi:hypothetical protein
LTLNLAAMLAGNTRVVVTSQSDSDTEEREFAMTNDAAIAAGK